MNDLKRQNISLLHKKLMNEYGKIVVLTFFLSFSPFVMQKHNEEKIIVPNQIGKYLPEVRRLFPAIFCINAADSDVI